MGVKCSASSHKFRKVFPSALCSTPREGWESEKHLMLWTLTLIRHKVRQPRFFFLPEDLWRLYPSQVWRLVCYPRSPALPRHSGAIPGTAWPCWLCEHRGEKAWAAGAVQFPLAGWLLQGHHWSEGKVLRGAKSLFCHSSSREIPAAGALTGSAENHISLRKRLCGGQRAAKGNSWAPAVPSAEEEEEEEKGMVMLIQRWQIWAASKQTSASQRGALLCSLGKVGAVSSLLLLI